MSTTSPTSNKPALVPKHHPFYRRRWFHVTAILITASLTAFLLAIEWIIHHIQPLVRQRVVQTLSERFDQPVELDSLDISMLKSAGLGLLVEGHGLRIPYGAHGTNPDLPAGPAAPNHPPLVSVRSFRFHTTLRGLLHSPTTIGRTEVEGVEVFVPPPAERATLPGVGKHGLPADPEHPHTRPRISLVFAHIDVTDAKILIQGSHPDKDPLEFDVQEAHLRHAGAHTRMAYDAILTNPKPLGLIHATGFIGPWGGRDADTPPDGSIGPPDPGLTPLSGDFAFDHADLNTIKGIGGTLAATGHFDGILERLVTDGTADVPNFSLDLSRNPVPLHTRFHAIVDGTSGDTHLQPVQARLLDSNFTCSGDVVNVKGRGKDIQLDVDIPDARIEDFLRLAVHTLPPLMNGRLSMKARLHIPPGKVSVTDKMAMQGTFGITAVRFNDPKFQDRVDGLSVRATGHPEEVKQASQDRKAEVQSRLRAGFTLAHGQMEVRDVDYQIPGAEVLLNGVYSMDGKVFEFQGHARTRATLSQMVGGWKGALLKPMNRFFEKNNAGVELPIEIHGAGAEGIHFGLALHGVEDSPAAIAHDMHDRIAEDDANRHAAKLVAEADAEDKLAGKNPDLADARRHHDRAVSLRAEALAESNRITVHQAADEQAAKARKATEKTAKQR